ncbi:hypothetical protein [Burkholderia sp. Bp8998]|uniref:hypothetical protein n=1 Tax=Burkholderia sp. Bp8998 TaxID=2184557 RepID=UPI000F598E73|nr:hypothetical protein [Burkholderia sp. Bp8998]RQS15866.1 hypothetical protein DIE06_21775 [Burkholderia sp. Bp8998]
MNITQAEINAQFAGFSFGETAQPAAATRAEGGSSQVAHPLRALPPRKASVDLLSGSSSPSGVPGRGARIKLIMDKVKAEFQTAHPLTLSEQAVADGGFMLAEHVRAVSIAMRTMNAGCSFCHAGEWTLRKIAAGAEAKGHDTLDKTLKPSSISGAFPSDTAQRILRDAENANILGYVATLNAETQSGALVMGRKVAGFEVSEEPEKEALGAALEYGSNGKQQYHVDFSNVDASLETLKAVKDWEQLPLTGDYDLHDLFSLAGQPHTVPSNSPEESFLIDAINAAISAADSSRRPRSDPSMNLVKHGPQVNYVAYTKAEESGTQLKRTVAEPRFPLAMYVAKFGWTIVKDKEQLIDMYTKCNVAMKQTWTPRGSQSFEGPEDNVTLRRRSSAPMAGGSGTPRRTSLANVLDGK